MPRKVLEVDVAVLGPLRVVVRGLATPLPATQQRLLVARLAVDFGSVVTSDALISALWDERAPETAAKVVQVLVGRVRQVLGPETIESSGGGYRLARSRVRLDAEALEAELVRAREFADRAAWDDVQRALSPVLASWRGTPLDEFAQAPWARPSVVRWKAARRAASLLQAQSWIELGAFAPAIQVANDLLAQDPSDEPALATLVRALRASGDVAGADRALDRGAASLVESHGLSIGVATGEAPYTRSTSDVASRQAPRVDHAAVLRMLARVDGKVAVTTLLDAGQDDWSDEAEALDALELLVERGDLVRGVDIHGVVHVWRPEAVGP